MQKEMTVNEIRVRLGKLVEKMYTEDFIEIYEMMVPQVESKTDIIIPTFLEGTDAYLQIVSVNLSDPGFLTKVNKFIYPMIVYCVFIRYHSLSMKLVESNQDEVLKVPCEDSEFFQKMLISYWKELYLP